MKEEDEDPVVREFPVYLSKQLLDNLFVFQYPTRPNSQCVDYISVPKSCIKPENQEVRLEFSIDTKNKNYDKSKGEQIAINVDGKSKNAEENFFNSKLMDKQIMHGSKVNANLNKYAVGVLQDGELHLTPIKGMVQIRPTFEYLDKSDKLAKDELKEKDESAEEEEEIAEQVTVKFARQENDRIKKAREKTFGFIAKKRAEEAWFHTDFVPSFAESAELERNKLFCSKITEKVHELSLGEQDYLKDLISCEVESSNDKVSHPSSVTSLSAIKLMPLIDQVKVLLRDAKLIQFSHLVSILSADQDVTGVLRAVQQVAVLVQGNWVVRSELLYPKDSSSYANGIPAELMCRGRDYILYHFTQNRYVDRRKMSLKIKIPSEEIREILTQISELKAKKGWELILNRDDDFIDKYSEVVQRQQMWWEAKFKQLTESFKELPTSSRPRKKSIRDSDGENNMSPTRRQRRRSIRDSDSDANTSPRRQRKKSFRDSDSDVNMSPNNLQRHSFRDSDSELASGGQIRRKSVRDSDSDTNVSSGRKSDCEIGRNFEKLVNGDTNHRKRFHKKSASENSSDDGSKGKKNSVQAGNERS